MNKRMNGRFSLPKMALVILLFSSILSGCLTDQQQRPPGTDGSARWAYDLALPKARSDLGPDAVLVEISGQGVMPDGRLAANTGQWVLSFSSFDQAARVPITVDFNRNVNVGSRISPGRIEPLSGTFSDSTVIFQATSGHGASGARKVEDPVVCRLDNVAGTHVWFIKFNVGGTSETHEVRWDGVWQDVR